MNPPSTLRPGRAWLRPVARAWIATGAVPGPNGDELADGQIGDALAALGPDAPSLLAIQHPHRTPHAQARGWSVEDALPAARDALARLERGAYHETADVVLLYHIQGGDGEVWGVMCMADLTATGPDGLPRVRRTEAVGPGAVEVRRTVMAGLRRATSAVLLTPVVAATGLTAAIRAAAALAGPPAALTIDERGRAHHLWTLGPGATRDAVLAAASAHPLLVADGNHRAAASAAAGVDGMLAMVTAGPDLRIGAFHRVLSGTGLDGRALESAWLGTGIAVRPAAPIAPERPGHVVVVTADGARAIELPHAGRDARALDHSHAEQLLLAHSLGIDPDGTAVSPLPASGYRGTLPRGADAILLFAPARLDDVLAVHRAGERMPRKSTYFTPKPLSGLVLAELQGELDPSLSGTPS